jgi:hypothetical protein
VKETERQSYFASLSEMVEMQEVLIGKHPPETSVVYFGGKGGLISQLIDNFPSGGDLERHEFLIVVRYLLSLSFIAAWADLHEPGFDRKKAATAAMMPLSFMSDEFRSKAGNLHLHMQDVWKKALRQTSPQARGNRSGCFGLLLVLLTVGLVGR